MYAYLRFLQLSKTHLYAGRPYLAKRVIFTLAFASVPVAQKTAEEPGVCR